MEIMGYPPGQTSYRFHLLGLEELRFQSLSLGNVASDSQHAPLPLDVDHFRRHVCLPNLSVWVLHCVRSPVTCPFFSSCRSISMRCDGSIQKPSSAAVRPMTSRRSYLSIFRNASFTSRYRPSPSVEIVFASGLQ